ncbi:ParB N-terminal domain-containing protein [Streptomyces sp. NPDC056600]|uniref:ParB N-terminal domain-containing protein n=1 Tax=Streptomyces sp. NPDC056600 TaxID=3345874 RepID=UPI0036C847C9
MTTTLDRLDKSEHVVELAVARLTANWSPRLGAPDPAHVRLLAERLEDLPPVVVQRSTLRVLDGRHRLAAARLRGLERIPARCVDVCDAEAFVTAVRLNASHGLPLAAHERAAAVRRVLLTHPERSDRWIAALCGVAVRTVASLRADAGPGGEPDRQVRVGRDGRRRPLSAQAGRQAATEIMRREPGASLRDVARRAGISVGTALDVRRRLAAADGEATGPHGTTGTGPGEARVGAPPVAGPPALEAARTRLAHLVRDPSLKYTDNGRSLLRLAASTLTFVEQAQWAPGVTTGHSRESLRLVARACAEGWLRLGEHLADAERDGGPPDGEHGATRDAGPAVAAPGS